MVASDPMPIGDLIQFWFLAGLFFSPIQVLGGQYNQALTAMAGAERVFGLLDQEPEWSDLPNAVTIADAGSRGSEHRAECRSRTNLVDRCCMMSPSMQRRGRCWRSWEKPEAESRRWPALVARYYLPTSGTIWLDGIDTRTVTSESLSRVVSVVPQQNFLFSGTVLENIVAGRPGAGASRMPLPPSSRWIAFG